MKLKTEFIWLSNHNATFFPHQVSSALGGTAEVHGHLRTNMCC